MRYLSAEWFTAAREAMQRDRELRELASELDLTIEQTVTHGPEDLALEQSPEAGTAGPSSRAIPHVIRWHVVLHHGSVQLGTGPAPEADLRFRATYAVARAIATGALAAPIAFIRGELTVGGDLTLLTTHQRTLAALGDVLRDVRQATTYA